MTAENTSPSGNEPGICMHCLQLYEAQAPATCSACGRSKMRRHGELLSLSLAHIDCDAFYASVEKRDNPALRNTPLIVGGGARGVVTTACYLARIHGVRSAMPMFKARRLCPQAVIIKPRMAHYRAVSRDIRALMLEATPQIEPISVDEAFLDLSGTQRLHKAPPALTLLRLAQRIEAQVGITVSIGLSYNKYLAKVASDMDKPRGFHVIGRDDAIDFLAEQPISLLWGVGQSFSRTLARDGITRISQIQSMSQADLMKRYGSMGSHIWHLATGQDSRKVTAARPAKSISSERTFSKDINNLETLSDVLWSLCEDVSETLKTRSLMAKTVQLKLKTAEFQTITRSHTPASAITATSALFGPARTLLERCADGRDFRLLGVGVSGLSARNGAPLEKTLFEDGSAPKAHKLDDVMSEIRSRFGKTSIETGRGNRARASGLNRRQSVSKSQREED